MLLDCFGQNVHIMGYCIHTKQYNIFIELWEFSETYIEDCFGSCQILQYTCLELMSL